MTTSSRLRLIAARIAWYFPVAASEISLLASEVRKLELSLDDICHEAQEQAGLDAEQAAAVRASANVVRLPRGIAARVAP